MRAKTGRVRRRKASTSRRVGGQSTAEWLLQAEFGWGFPHWILALPGLLVLGGRALSLVVAQVRDRHDRRPRGPAGA